MFHVWGGGMTALFMIKIPTIYLLVLPTPFNRITDLFIYVSHPSIYLFTEADCSAD